jgi:predicted nucleic acid-binding protein
MKKKLIVICDACPIIFLAKINCLKNIKLLLGKNIIIPEIILKEVLSPVITPFEERVLDNFIKDIKVIKAKERLFKSKALSKADNFLLSYAVKNKVDLVLSDDNLIRKVSKYEKINVLGTLGVLLNSLKKGLNSSEEIKSKINQLIKLHNFRISIEVYEEVITTINNYNKLNRL